MLKQRILTAIALLLVLIPALLADNPVPFALLTVVMVSAAGWEWARLNGLQGGPAVGMGLLVAALCLLLNGMHLIGSTALIWLGAALWLIGGPLALRAGVPGWPGVPRGVRWLLGVLILVLAWLTITSARAHGLNYLFSVFCLVWVADSAAYFGGRAWGRRKLAPAISPGKSWAGVWTGLGAVLAMATTWILIDRALGVTSTAPSLYTVLWQRHGLLALIAVIFLTAYSVIGDLFESLVKRSAGAKDSSQLLPGHGGVLDRIDALLPTFPLVAWMVS